MRQFAWPLAAALMLISASACARGPSDSGHSFQALNRAVQDIKPGLIGEVVYDGTRGAEHPLTQGPTRYVLIIASGDKSAVLRAVAERMSAAGFRVVNPTAWRRVRENETVLAYVELFNSDQKTPRGTSVPAGHIGAWLNLNTGI